MGVTIMKVEEICFKIDSATLNLIGDGCYPDDVCTLFCVGKDLTIQLCGYSSNLKKEYLLFEKGIKYIGNKNYYEINGKVEDSLEIHAGQELLIDCEVPIRITLNKKGFKIKKGDCLTGKIYLYGNFEATWDRQHLIKKVRGKILKIEKCLKTKEEICLESQELKKFEATIFIENPIYITLHITAKGIEE